MRTIIHAGAIILAGLVVSSSAHAQGAGTGPVGQYCAEDLKTYCANVPHGNMQARQCLEDNMRRLSDDCRRALANTGGGRGMGRNRQAPQDPQ